MLRLAMRASAARGSPWLPVQAITHLVARQRAVGSLGDRNRHAVEVAGLARRLDDPPQRAADQHDLAAGGRGGSAIDSMRATLEAKLVIATRPSRLAIRSVRLSRDAASEGERPRARRWWNCRSCASTPSSPSARSVASSIGSARSSGVGIELPVAGMEDGAERRADDERVGLGDRMGQVTSSISNGPTSKRLPRVDDGDRDIGRARFASRSWRRAARR